MLSSNITNCTATTKSLERMAALTVRVTLYTDARIMLQSNINTVKLTALQLSLNVWRVVLLEKT